MSLYSKWYHPYNSPTKYAKKVAYFSMEFAIDQPLKTYSGGLGFLAGSHMRSAFEICFGNMDTMTNTVTPTGH